MTEINIAEAKAHLGKYISASQEGEQIVLCVRNHPVAELRPLSHPSGGPLLLGVLEGKLQVDPSFDAPLHEFEKDFYG